MNKNAGKNLHFSGGLTWAKDLTDVLDTGSFSGAAPQDIYCLGCEYGNNALEEMAEEFEASQDLIRYRVKICGATHLYELRNRRR